MPLHTSLLDTRTDQLVLTFDELLRRTPLARLLREMLKLLEEHYHSPVDTEFTVQINNPRAYQPEVTISLLQCRPQSHLRESRWRQTTSFNPADIVFRTRRVVPEGYVEDIHYVVFIPPEGYYALATSAERSDLVRAISLLNKKLKGENFICVGPGRWGTTNPDLGVSINYGDIYNTRALVEVSGQGIGSAPEPSFGTHFFQDLIEANIYPLGIFLDDEDAMFNREFFYKTPNRLLDYLPDSARLIDSLRLIEVDTYRPGCHLELSMDDEKSQATAFLSAED
jgi:hypothetical protein